MTQQTRTTLKSYFIKNYTPTQAQYEDLIDSCVNNTDDTTGGDLVGPASSTDGNVVLFDGATGKLVKDSGVAISGSNTGDETTTTLGSKINGATEKTTPVNADMVGLMDSEASNILKKLSWTNIKATLKTYFDTLYTTGPASATDNAIVIYNGTTGKIVKNSVFTINSNLMYSSSGSIQLGNGNIEVENGQVYTEGLSLWGSTPYIYDEALNEIIKCPFLANAVNEITVQNAVTGTGPTISATGGDTNINLNFAGKGTGRITINSSAPASAGASGKVGSITWDSDYIYICVATDTRKRVGISTW